MTTADDWKEEFEGPKFESLETEFHYNKLAREIDMVKDIKVLQEMMKQYIRIHLREKEILKKIQEVFPSPLNTEE